MSGRTPQLVYEFGPYRVDVARRCLIRGGSTVPLTPKVFETLLLLVENSGRVVTKDEMMQQLWPDTFVEESSLSQNVFHLRRALGDDKSEPQYIATIPKRGYHFLPRVNEIVNSTPEPSTEGASRNGVDGPVLAINSLAVLPFKALGVERNDELLGLGMADAIIIRLNELQQIQVSPTSAMFRYTDSENNPLTVGRELGVDAVLDGTTQQADEQVRVTVQLLRVSDGRNLWSAKFDEHYTNIFAVQDSISEQVARSLALQITADEKQLSKLYPDNTEAYQTYLMGLYFWNKRTRDGLNRAIEYFEQTIAQDPGYALAYAGLADCYFLRLAYNFESSAPGILYERVRATAMKALELDPGLAEAHAALAVVRVKYDRDVTGAERSFSRAIAANPNCLMALLRYAWFLTAMGRLDEGLLIASRAQVLDPLSPESNAALGHLLYFARRYDEAIAYCRRALDIEPGFVTAHLYLGLNYLQKRMYAEAIDEFEKGAAEERCELLVLRAYVYALMGCRDEAQVLLDESDLGGVEGALPYNRAMIYAEFGQTERALELVAVPCDNWTERLRVLRYDPRLDLLRSEPGYENFYNGGFNGEQTSGF
ncbi:MAG TPA: winged helix-turn-helix domain-containing protein [Pyrinomonadaceae bacterium]|nr:winged helix-turn-helix domain-containing protein [Pyrinomonadaceae bacterium]